MSKQLNPIGAKYQNLDRIVIKNPETFGFQLTKWVLDNSEEMGFLALPLELDLKGTDATNNDGKVDFKKAYQCISSLAEQRIENLRESFKSPQDKELFIPQSPLGSLNTFIDYKVKDKPIARGIYIALGCPKPLSGDRHNSDKRRLLEAVHYQATSSSHRDNPLGTGYPLALLRNLLVLQALKDEGCPLDALNRGFAVLGINNDDFLYRWDKNLGNKPYKSEFFSPVIQGDSGFLDSFTLQIGRAHV